MRLIERLENELKRSNGKLSKDFIDNELNSRDVKVSHTKIENTRVCVVVLPSGHELVGYSRVLDPKNDIKEIGESIAYRNAIEGIWEVYGSICKALME